MLSFFLSIYPALGFTVPIVSLYSFFADLDDRFRGLVGLLIEDLEYENCIWICAIHYPPSSFFVIDTKLMAPGPIDVTTRLLPR
jgi:hypothetical protein